MEQILTDLAAQTPYGLFIIGAIVVIRVLYKEREKQATREEKRYEDETERTKSLVETLSKNTSIMERIIPILIRSENQRDGSR